MRVLLFFNELSCANEASESEIDERMVEFVELVRQARGKRRDTALVTTSPFKDMELGDDYHVRQWINKRENRDRWRLLQSARNVSPVSSVLPESASAEVEYHHQGRAAEAIGGAHLADGLAVSLAVESTWHSPWVVVDRTQAVEDADGSLSLEKDVVGVRHAAGSADLRSHDEWLVSSGLSGITTGGQLWQAREDFFPHLRFLPRTKDDLEQLETHRLRAVRERLLELEAAMAEWRPELTAQPAWKSHVTPESATRKSLCEFRDTDGALRTFDMHARFTPGAGRLHFRLVPGEGVLTVAYIGKKL
ncbi:MULTISPECIES: hypothetical protein [unclassified Actinopolyspora]|uniref:hypothetical protein n=1 Tax=unclassified Actinopolyspora TaxID=2639451 RepID=UPI0013F624AF|nr:MULTISPECIES: hypothetical protein [unclassified Actinopolyspora]NHD19020.1 hypothetical protein [Actinopolyspora sp. BKK2]NHE78195.1 hypothetical protein [Actinopolyspora sp. BKK1]